MLQDIQTSILTPVSNFTGIPAGAVHIGLAGQKAFRQNSEHIQIVSKTDKDGIDIRIAPFTKSENVHIPVVLSRAGFHDMVYNDFFVGEGADVTIVAGCGIHTCGACASRSPRLRAYDTPGPSSATSRRPHPGCAAAKAAKRASVSSVALLLTTTHSLSSRGRSCRTTDSSAATSCAARLWVGMTSEIRIIVRM